MFFLDTKPEINVSFMDIMRPCHRSKSLQISNIAPTTREICLKLTGTASVEKRLLANTGNQINASFRNSDVAALF